MDGSVLLQAIWVAIHLVGLAAAWMVRRDTTSQLQRIAHSSFFACLPLIALVTIVGQILCLTTWPLSGATLGVMIVTAVAESDTRAKPQAARDRM